MPEFNHYSIKFIEKLVFFVGYNEDYDEVAKLEINFKVFKDKEEYSLVMLFEDVSSLNLEDFCKHQQVGIFQLEDMSLRGYESQMRYRVGDFDDQHFEFNCSNYEVVSFERVL